MERFLREIQYGNTKIWFSVQKRSKLNFDFVSKYRNHPSFVNISPTVAIDKSMERSVLLSLSLYFFPRNLAPLLSVRMCSGPTSSTFSLWCGPSTRAVTTPCTSELMT